MVALSWLSGGLVELRHHHCRRSTTWQHRSAHPRLAGRCLSARSVPQIVGCASVHECPLTRVAELSTARGRAMLMGARRRLMVEKPALVGRERELQELVRFL